MGEINKKIQEEFVKTQKLTLPRGEICVMSTLEKI